jgi:DNA polymerase-1
MEEKKILFLFDAYALIYRAYFAFSKNPLINSKGINTSAISGFLSSLHEILSKHQPTHAAVVFDSAATTDRQTEFEFYKANRQAMPEDIATSIPYIKKIIKEFNIPIIELDGYEADDLIGTIAKKAEKDYTVYMVTPDKDFAQLVDENIFIYKPSLGAKPMEILDVKAIKEKWEVEDPMQVIDILGLWGDAVDNIPGVYGIGEKTAKKLIVEFGSIENIYENLDNIQGKTKEKLEANKENALISKKLATIIVDAPIQFDDKNFRTAKPNTKELERIFNELEFRTLGKRILGESYSFNSNPPANQQPTLFDNLFTQQEVKIESEEEEIIGKNAENIEHQYFTIDTKEKLINLVEVLRKAEIISWDTETTGLDAMACNIVGVSISTKPHTGYYIPLPKELEKAKEILDHFRELWEDDSKTFVGQNIKFDLLILKNYGYQVKNKFFDTMLAHYVMEPESRHNMTILSETYLGYSPIPIENLIGKKGSTQGNMRNVAIDKITEYAAEDADVTIQLYQVFKDELKELSFENIFYDIEMPLMPVLTDMEKNGISLDTDFLKNYSLEINEELIKNKDEIFKITEVEFNLDSPKQMGEILFDKMKIPYVGKKTKTGQYSTNEETLEKLSDKHEIIEKILTHRELTKLKSTYVDTLPNLVNPNTGKIHTTFNQAVAVTGRLSSQNPNLQNIPIRTDRGKKIRQAFTSSEEKILLAADYSQIELRIIASISKDENMISAFNEKQDIHASTAANLFSIPLSEVTSDMRRKAKVVNFGIIYGISAFGLSERLKIPRGEAAEMINAYFEKYKGIKNYMLDIVQSAKEKGYVETLLGRRRYLRDINSRNQTIRGFAERNAINAPIQGTAADMIKLAMIKIDKRLTSEKLETKMILQVHDELLFDVIPSELEKVKTIVNFEMQNALPLSVPIVVDMGTGKNWLQAH